MSKVVSMSIRRNEQQNAEDASERGKVKLLLTPQQAAEALAITRTTLYKLLGSGEIQSIYIGRARRIPIKVLEEYIDQQLELAA